MGELKLLPCSHSDAAEILEGQFAAFSDPHEEFFFCLFPKEEDREVAVKRAVEWWVGDESARYMKVVDVESGEFGCFIHLVVWIPCYKHRLVGRMGPVF
jgi:hypothetical protein